MKEKTKFFILIWAIVFLIWILLISFWHTNTATSKIFMTIYTLVIIIWSIIVIVQSRKHKKNNN